MSQDQTFETETYYDVLQVSENASSKELKKKRNELLRDIHPDQNQKLPDWVVQEAHERTIRINEAYEVLNDPIKRKQYDEELRKIRTSSSQSSQQSTSPPPPPRSSQSNNQSRSSSGAHSSAGSSSPPKPPPPPKASNNSGTGGSRPRGTTGTHSPPRSKTKSNSGRSFFDSLSPILANVFRHYSRNPLKLLFLLGFILILASPHFLYDFVHGQPSAEMFSQIGEVIGTIAVICVIYYLIIKPMFDRKN